MASKRKQKRKSRDVRAILASAGVIARSDSPNECRPIGVLRSSGLIRTNEIVWRFQGSRNLILLPNPQRIAVTVTVVQKIISATQRIMVTADSKAICQLSALRPTWHFSILQYGDLPTKRFSLTIVESGPSGLWIEYLLPENVLAEPIESHYNQYGLAERVC